MITARFYEDGGLIWVDLGSNRVGFNEALNDGVSSLSPLGQPAAVSTYWVDHALARMDTSSPGEQITGGNVTDITRTERGVCARSEYDAFEDEEMDDGDFVALLRAWRAQITALQAARDPARSELVPYQRNPFP